MIQIDDFNCEDIILQYGYEDFKDVTKDRKELMLHISSKILELNSCIHDGNFFISLNTAKQAAHLVMQKMQD